MLTNTLSYNALTRYQQKVHLPSGHYSSPNVEADKTSRTQTSSHPVAHEVLLAFLFLTVAPDGRYLSKGIESPPVTNDRRRIV